MFRSKVKQWGKKRRTSKTFQSSPSVMVWGSTGHRGATTLKIGTGSAKSPDYINILKECLLSDMSVVYPDS
jgi:hypothetical protein